MFPGLQQALGLAEQLIEKVDELIIEIAELNRQLRERDRV